MKLFGRRSARSGGRAALARGWATPALGKWPTSYEAQVREGYAGNPVAQRAVRMVAEGVAGAPVEASAPELAALIACPSSGQGLLEACAVALMLHGNAYVQVLGDGRGGVGELFALRPERVRVEADADGWPAAYLYTVGGQTLRLVAAGERPEVIHLKLHHPLDDHYGLGCLVAAAGAIAIHNAATRWNKALLDNAARPSGALVYEPGDGATLSADQYRRLKEEMDSGFAGAANAGRPMLLEGGLKWQAMSLSPADMDFVGLKAAAAREVALAFGVPPMLLGLPGDAAYANYREANRALWRLTVLPLAGTVLNGIAHGVKGWWPEARLAVDLNRVPALAEDRERLWRQVSAADFLSVEEKRELLGIAS
jgi:HK97 family phage portal protein